MNEDALSIENMLFMEDELDEYGDPIEQEEYEDDSDDSEDVEIEEEEYEYEDYEEEEVEEDEEVEYEEEEEQVEETKQVQSSEENAYFAELRRQKQNEEKYRAELQSQFEQSPEYKMAQMLSSEYGLTTQELLEQMQQASLEKEAEKQGVPVEYLQRVQESERRQQELESKLQKMEFESWYNGKLAEKEALKNKFNGIISDEEIDQAMMFVLEDLRNTNISLDKAVRLVHGDKIESELKRIAKQEALAEISGRKQSPLARQSSKTTVTETLSPAERAVARAMGISDEDYIKYKS